MITLKIGGAPALDLSRFTCREGVSQLYEIVADASVDRADAPLAFDAVLGHAATITIDLPGDKKRFFHGIVRGITQGGANTAKGSFAAVPYRFEIVPTLWLLTRRTNSRMFQQMSVKDILAKVLTGLTTRYELNATYEPRDYCTQYRETDFDFASRLMEEEGIYYFFEHADGQATLVLGDTPGTHKALPVQSALRFEAFEGGTRAEDRVDFWEKRQSLTSGKVTLWDHTFELPHKHLDAQENVVSTVQVGTISHKVKLPETDKLEVYDYPGEYAKRFSGTAPGGGDRASDVQKIFQDNTRTAKLRAQQVAAGAIVIHGRGTVKQMTAGHKFTLSNHPDANGDYVLTTVEHAASLEGSGTSGGEPGVVYENSFTCVPAAVAYHPPRLTPRPLVRGCQTAVVVGPSGEEIFVDKYGRVKVQFHWDREGKNDANSSTWIRVATSWAGQQWGAIHIPRVGQEVVVDFLEGDPDRPIIVGSVYNAEQMPPYALPANKTQSGIKSRSSAKGTAANFNEIRFEDKKGSEQLFIHAEKNQDIEVENDETHTVGHDQTVSIGHDRTEDVGNDETITIAGNRTESVTKNETIDISGNRTETVAKDESIDVAGKRTLTVAKDQKTSIGGALSTSVGKGEIREVAAERATDVGKDDTLKVGKKLHIEAGDEIVLKTGDASITMKKDGTIKIDGKDVTVNGSGKINVKASSDVTVKGSKVAMN
jgi:type VI secretion system secreted protein VgrG